jgi:RNA polymerase sigma-70 factor (ECF subfamily)
VDARAAGGQAGAPGDTAELVRRARQGELAAFNVLVLRHQDQAYSLALRFLGSPQAAEDVTQEAFLRAFRHLDRFRGERFHSWLLSIVANAARDELRRARRRPQRSLDAARADDERPAIDPADPGPLPEQLALQGELRGELERALRTLPDDWRLVVLLADVHELAYEEVAVAAGIPVGTVKSRLSRARARLRAELGPRLRPGAEPQAAPGRQE